MVHQPDPEKKPDMLAGILAIRHMHMRAVAETGLTAADEMLYPENWRYLSDILSYVAVGARSVENQQHRLIASGLDMPVGMKNPTSGDSEIMLNSVLAAQNKQTFLYHGYECESRGNAYAHAVLRGYTDMTRKSHSNYHYEDISDLFDLCQKKNIMNANVIIDCNHDNSRKHYDEQIRIGKEVFSLCRDYSFINEFVKGVMIESYLEDGAQMIGENIYGKSVTDPCLGWYKTEKMIKDLAEMIV